MLDPEVAVLIPPNTPFATGLDQPFAHFFVHFNFDRDELIPEQRMIRKLDAGSIILPYIRKNLSTMSERQLCWAASSIVSAALLQLPPEAFNAGDYQEEHNFFNRAVRLMEDDPAFALTAGELAEQCGTSVNTLQRQFLSATGLSIRKWLLNRKMENAVQLLTVRKFSIKETAYELAKTEAATASAVEAAAPAVTAHYEGEAFGGMIKLFAEMYDDGTIKIWANKGGEDIELASGTYEGAGLPTITLDKGKAEIKATSAEDVKLIFTADIGTGSESDYELAKTN